MTPACASSQGAYCIADNSPLPPFQRRFSFADGARSVNRYVCDSGFNIHPPPTGSAVCGTGEPPPVAGVPGPCQYYDVQCSDGQWAQPLPTCSPAATDQTTDCTAPATTGELTVHTANMYYAAKLWP